MKVYVVLKEYVGYDDYIYKIFLNESEAYKCCNDEHGSNVEEHEVIE